MRRFGETGLPLDLDAWLDGYLAALTEAFGSRIRFVGLQGSAARGEATEESDIDLVVILDTADAADIETYRTGSAVSLPGGRSFCAGSRPISSTSATMPFPSMAHWTRRLPGSTPTPWTARSERGRAISTTDASTIFFLSGTPGSSRNCTNQRPSSSGRSSSGIPAASARPSANSAMLPGRKSARSSRLTSA